MGISPRGSNGRPRSTLVFTSPEDRNLFKQLAADLAEWTHVAPTEAVLDALIRGTVGTPEGEQTVRAVYSTGDPSCKALFVDFYRQLVLAGDKGRDALPVLEIHIDYITRYDACVDTTDGKASHLASLWEQLVSMLDELAATGDPDAVLAAKTAGTVGTGVLRDSQPFVSPAILVHIIGEELNRLHDRQIAYAILHEISNLMRPTRRGVPEIAQDRLSLLRAIDTFYQGERR